MMARLVGVLSVAAQLTGTLSGGGALEGTITRPAVISPDPYGGPYEFLPGDTARTIEIEGLMATANIVIQPVPSNYGKITWNGSTLTVS